MAAGPARWRPPEIGIELSKEDIDFQAGEISDDELDAVTGGSDCLCVAAGGGYKDDHTQRCFCVMGGSGSDNPVN